MGGVTAVVVMTVHPPGPGGPSARSALCPCLEQPPRDSTNSAEIFWGDRRSRREDAATSQAGLPWASAGRAAQPKHANAVARDLLYYSLNGASSDVTLGFGR